MNPDRWIGTDDPEAGDYPSPEDELEYIENAMASYQAAAVRDRRQDDDRRRTYHFIPSYREMKEISKYVSSDACPQCRKGRLVLEEFGSNLGRSLVVMCRWGAESCNFHVDITDYDAW